jgi:hypothetical protein
MFGISSDIIPPTMKSTKPPKANKITTSLLLVSNILIKVFNHIRIP